MSRIDDRAPVYLDHAATTPLDPDVGRAMAACLGARGEYGNPSSIHVAGRRARDAIRAARALLAGLLNTTPRNLVFTSGATESDNLAILGSARFRAHRGRHLVTVTTEHKAVREPFDALEKEGFEVTRLAPASDGVLPPDRLAGALRADTQLVSVMHVNNETGVVQDLETIGALCRQRDILLHVDAAQSVGKLPIDLEALPIDLLSISGHKFYGPQGVGALYVADRPGCGVMPLMYGGSQERRLRPGTLPLALIVGLGEAARLASGRMAEDLDRVGALAERLWDGLSSLPGIRRNGSAASHYPGILNVSAAGVEGESLMLALEPLCVSSGSACNSRSGEPSFVLKALGLSDREAEAAIRFSIGRDTTPGEIDFAIARYAEAVERLRSIAPEAA